jgi:hypothetical protein
MTVPVVDEKLYKGGWTGSQLELSHHHELERRQTVGSWY